ncbi:hypothetical protein ACE38V_13535 [Cytobacillus sp. Hz8]|uniref:hypothetical protein n=1 Tax=Cytobacillus sp. Hz8 TaxID=3347168 RepID=UPI0035D93F1A
MWAIVSILTAGMIAWIEIPSLLKKKLIKELWVFSVLLLIGVGLIISQSLQLNIPNPLDWITVVFKPLNDAIFGILK